MGCASSKTAKEPLPALLGVPRRAPQLGASVEAIKEELLQDCKRTDKDQSLPDSSEPEPGIPGPIHQDAAGQITQIEADAKPTGHQSQAFTSETVQIEDEVQSICGNWLCCSATLGDAPAPKESWQDEMAEISRILKSKLEDPHFVAESCDLDGSGNLDEHELRQAAMVFGARLTEEKLRHFMGEQKRMSKDQFADLVGRLSSDLPDSMRMPRTVPHSLRGMALGQLNLLDKLFLSSGWLEQQCRLHNEQHDAAIQSGTVFKQLPNLYAMDTHIVTPMSKPGHCLARDQDRSKSIPDALWARSFSELLNPNGCFIHFFVSHYWGHLFQKTLAALRIWAGNRSDGVGAGNPDSVVYWICLFALNQHRVAEEVGELPMQGPFNAALAHATGGAVMVLDEEVHPFRRIWCLFEVHRLDQLNQRFELICEKGPLAVLHEAVNEADRQAADKMLDDIANALWNASALKAQASNGDDLVSILDVIRDSPEHLLFKELDRKSEDGGTVFVLNPPEEGETTKGGSSKYHETTMVEMYSFHRFDEKVHALLSTPLLDRCLACENVAHARECLLHGARFTKETVVRFLALSQAHDQETQEILDDLLVVASEQGYAEEAAVLLSIGASAKGSKSIVAASARGHAPVVKLLVEAGANVTEDDLLMRAAGGGHAEVVKLLLEAGAPVSGMREGEVLLLNASCGGHDAVVKMLLEAGADVAEKTTLGITSLMAASQQGQKEVVKLLLCARADPSAADVQGHTSLMLAAKRRDEAVAKLLLEGGADISATDGQGYSALLLASRLGHVAGVKLLLEAGADVRAADENGDTSLMLASHRGHEAVVKLLLEAGADVQTRDENGKTSLMWASLGGHEAVVKLLFEAGADVSAEDSMGCTSLMLASMNGHDAVAKLLLAAGANLAKTSLEGRKTSLMVASMQGFASLVRLFLEAGADVAAADSQGQTSLFFASNGGHEAVVKLLLQAGADVAAANQLGVMPLGCACHEGYEAVVKLLLEAGANVQPANHKGPPFLALASQGGHEAVVKLLLEAGADVRTRDENGNTSLIVASHGGHEAVVKLLLEAGADVRTGGENGNTSLIVASHGGHEAVVKLLLEAGADVATTDQGGQTSPMLASRGGHEAVVKLLLEAGADVAATAQGDQTSLMLASRGGHEAVVKLLLEAGADVAATAQAGQTSLGLASCGGHEAVVKLLLEAGADVASADCSGQTSLGLASRAGHEAVVKLLLDAGADRTLLEQPSLEERNELDFGECLLLLALLQQGHGVEVRIPE